MKLSANSLNVVMLLLLVAPRSPAQTFFYPLHNGDTWVYWETAWNVVGINDTITVRVAGDTTIGGKAYKHISRWNWHYHQHWENYGRADSSGDVYNLDPTTGQESLSYRLSDTSRTWWQANGYLQRFDSCVVKEMFGQQRAVLYVGAYTVKDTMLRSQAMLVEGIGYYTSRPFNIIYDGGTTTLHHGWINGVLFGTDPFAPPPLNFPLHTGDQWYYTSAPLSGGGSFSCSVAGDTVMPNGRHYADIVTEKQGGHELFRQSGDSVWKYDLGLQNEFLYFNFSRGSGDTVSSFPWGHDTTDIIVLSTGTQTIFGAPRRIWIVYVNPLRRGVDDEYSLTLADSLGIIRRDPSFGDFYTLMGAEINGRVFGTVDDISVNKSSIPMEFTLSQNYPNPFNPSTTIRYALPHQSHVTLTVYNTLGQQVSQLINGEIESGNHEVQFNANNLASGVYFYRMQAGSYVETKSLLLIR